MSDTSHQSPGSSEVLISEDLIRARVSGPATAVMIVVSISIATLVVCLALDALLIAMGAIPRERFFQTGFRVLWSLSLIASNTVTFRGAKSMKQLMNYPLARRGIFLSMIPCLGPCFVLGIPFGVWAWTVLNDLDVRLAFREEERAH